MSQAKEDNCPLLDSGSWQVFARGHGQRPVSLGQDDCCLLVLCFGYKILPQSPQPQISFDLNQLKVRRTYADCQIYTLQHINFFLALLVLENLHQS